MTSPLQSAEAKPPEPPEETGPIRFHPQKRPDEEELDMTPMVDVTFLLLIFFMVTAAFSLQKSLEVPTPESQQSAAESEEEEDESDYVIVEIRRDDAVFVNEIAAPSKQELLLKLREAREGPPGSGLRGPSKMRVLADRKCRHEKVVEVLDAGNEVRMEGIQLETVENEFAVF